MSLCKKKCAGRQLQKRQKRWKQSSGHALNWMRPLPLNDISLCAPRRTARAPGRSRLVPLLHSFSHSTNKAYLNCIHFLLLKLKYINTSILYLNVYLKYPLCTYKCLLRALLRCTHFSI